MSEDEELTKDNVNTDELSKFINELSELRERVKQFEVSSKSLKPSINKQAPQQAKDYVDPNKLKRFSIENYNIIVNPSICRVVKKTTVPPNSQILVPFKCESELPAETLLFEPSYSTEKSREILIARSVHSRAEPLYCNIVNASNVEQVFEEGNIVGQLTEAKIAEQEFSNNVSSFTKLDTKLIHFSLENEKRSFFKPSFNSDKLQTGSNLSDSQRERLLAVLWKNSDAFQWNPNELSRTSLVEHSIPTGDHKPIQQKQYPIPSVAKEFLDN